MKIVVWATPQADENGNLTEMWLAHHVGKAISAQGPTAANAVFEMVRWLLLSLDEDEDRVPPLDLVFHDPPKFFEDAPPSALTDAQRQGRMSTAEQAALYELSKEEWLKRGLPVPPLPAPRPLYESSASYVADRHANGTPFTDAYVTIPEGWDIRVWEG